MKPETVKLLPEKLVTYKVFGEPGGAHYSHYDLVGGRLVNFVFLNNFWENKITAFILLTYIITASIILSLFEMQALDQVYPCIIEFLSCYDSTP